jgi:hypothetical protein
LYWILHPDFSNWGMESKFAIFTSLIQNLIPRHKFPSNSPTWNQHCSSA